MNIKEYISSGILEEYVMGLTTREESQSVERMADLHPEVREAISSIEKTLENYAGVYSKEPPPGLKTKIWEAIQANNGSPAGEVRSLSRAASPGIGWRIAASYILLAASALLNIFLYTKYRSAASSLAELRTENELFANRMEVQAASLKASKDALNMMSHPSTRTITLEGLASAPDASAMVYWNRNSGEVYLKVYNLPEPAAGKQYQLWAIVDGKPVDAGMISDLDSPMERMKDFSKAEAFAITLEKKGGSPAPTLEAMYVMGKV